MDIEELVVIYKKEKSWISSRLTSIDRLLERESHSNSNDYDSLVDEYEKLEVRMQELRHVADLIGKVNESNRLINLIEDNIDSLACFTGNEVEIENLYKEIEELEEKKNSIQEEIAIGLKIDEETKKNLNKR